MMRKIALLVFVLIIGAPGISFASCNALPNQLTNGNSADASQVMANFNYLLNCLNSANPPGGPAGGDLAGMYPNPNVHLSSPLPANQGGTGVNNGSNVLTLGGSLTTSGPSATTLTFGSGGSAYVFPGANDTLAGLGTADQTLSGGANLTSYSVGTITSGTTTIDCGKNPGQYLTNGGAFTLAAPANDSTCIVLVINNATAGAITFSGFSVGANTGDPLTTVNGNKFMISIIRIDGIATYTVKALQ